MQTPSNQSYREISLTQGQVALVDVEEYERLRTFSWYAKWSNKTKSYYAYRRGVPGKIAMHREVMRCPENDKRLVDHRSPSETLDNRKQNLRFSTYGQNRANSRLGKNNTSGFRGVTKYPNGWRAFIKKNKKSIYLGCYKTPEDAYAAYCKAAKEIHGEFARI